MARLVRVALLSSGKLHQYSSEKKYNKGRTSVVVNAYLVHLWWDDGERTVMEFPLVVTDGSSADSNARHRACKTVADNYLHSDYDVVASFLKEQGYEKIHNQ